MSTPAQIAASQTNGAKSHGPTTPEGLARSARNATTHGLTSSRVVIAGEDQNAFDRLLADYTARFRPRTEAETCLVFEVAAAQWRIRRATTFGNQLLNAEIEKMQNEPETPLDFDRACAAAWCNLTEKGGPLSQLHRHESRLWRAYIQAQDRLIELIADRCQEPDPDPVAAQLPQQNEPGHRPPKPKGSRPLPKLPVFSSNAKLPPGITRVRPEGVQTPPLCPPDLRG